MSIASPQSAALTETDLKRRIDEVERRLTAFRREQENRSDPVPLESAETLAGIEQDVIELSGQVNQSKAGLDGNALLADVAEVEALCQRLNLDDAAKSAATLTSLDLEHTAQAWKESLSPILENPQPETCFTALVQTTAYELEAESHDPNRTNRHEVFADIRVELRQALLEGIKQTPPDAATCLNWVRDLIDRADLALTSVDNLPSERAAVQLEIVAQDLRWHLEHVETHWNRSRRRLKRKLFQLEAERQERQLQARLYRKFGRRFVRRMDRLILFLICLVVGLIAAEAVYALNAYLSRAGDANWEGIHGFTGRTRFWVNIVDGAACCVFLSEFFVKLAMVQGKWMWFYRHFFVDFVPSIPFGLVALIPGAAGSRMEVVLSILKSTRMLRLIQLFRGFGLLARGFDRLARQYGHILNQNVILYPTREELDNSKSRLPAHRARLIRMREQVHQAWRECLTQMPESQRPAAVECRLAVLSEALAQRRQHETISPLGPRFSTREIAAEVLIEHLSTMTPQTAEVGLGPELLTQLARVVRIMARAPFCWLPIISSLVPRVTPDMTDADVVAAASRKTARLARKFHNGYFWFADLYGTVTPSQFVDRVGSMLVKSSAKPAYRMLIFGGLYLLTVAILQVIQFSILKSFQLFLTRFVATFVLILGSVCFFFLGIGWWLKRVAREATEFYERSAQAQFLSLTEIVHSRYLERDGKIFCLRILGPERLLMLPDDDTPMPVQLEHVLSRIHQSLVEAHLGSGNGQGWRGLDTVMLLYRDWLDGGIFNDTDTRSTSQLLGSPAVRQVLSLSCRINKKDLKKLHALDLVRQKSLFGGPYIWFNFVSRSIAHSVANLLIDYSQNAIPLNELQNVSGSQRRKYEDWVHGRDHKTIVGDDQEELVEKDYITNAFTALHFLDFDEMRDREVLERFGPDVLARLVRDRSHLIRRIFGTYPMHNRPKEQRVVNLYSLYGSWLSGGRALFLPWFLFLLVLDLFGGLLIWMARSVQQIRKPETRRDSGDAAKAHFLTAVRKIERIRGPVVYVSTRLRMRVDPEFLGVPLPTHAKTTLGEATVDHDIQFLNPIPEFLDEVTQERQRAQADMQRLEGLIQNGLLERAATRRGLPCDAFSSREHLRAAAVAYLADYDGVRSQLSAPQVLQEVVRLAETWPVMPGKWLPKPRLKKHFRRYWAKHGFGDAHTRMTAWRAVLNNYWNAADVLAVWSESPVFSAERGGAFG